MMQCRRSFNFLHLLFLIISLESCGRNTQNNSQLLTDLPQAKPQNPESVQGRLQRYVGQTSFLVDSSWEGYKKNHDEMAKDRSRPSVASYESVPLMLHKEASQYFAYSSTDGLYWLEQEEKKSAKKLAHLLPVENFVTQMIFDPKSKHLVLAQRNWFYKRD